MRSFLLLIFALVLVVGCTNPEPAPRIAEAVHSDVVLAFGSDTCGACKRNKPQLAQLRSQGIWVVYVDNVTNLIPLPTYLLVRDGSIVLETHSIEELKSAL